MDRRIPPESPPVPVRNENLVLNVKQDMQREAFDSALQRADQRRTMDSRDRIVLAGVKQAHTAPPAAGQSNLVAQPHAELNALSMLKSTQRCEQFDMEQDETGLELVHAGFSANELSSEQALHGSSTITTTTTTASTTLLSEESLAMLFKKIRASECLFGESIQLEIVDDPNGVMQISLTRAQSSSWAVNVVLTTQEKQGGADDAELSDSLVAQLRQSGILVDAVSVESDG